MEGSQRSQVCRGVDSREEEREVTELLELCIGGIIHVDKKQQSVTSASGSDYCRYFQRCHFE